jgi:hypothetical protein
MTTKVKKKKPWTRKGYNKVLNKINDVKLNSSKTKTENVAAVTTF